MGFNCQLSQKTSFISMITLTTSFFIVEIVVGYLTNSMALVADSFHMLSDVVSLFVGYVALRYSKLGQQTGRYTFGWARAEVLGALVNAVFLAALCFSILVEALKRVIIPEEIESPKLVLLVGTIGLVVNLIGLFLFHQHGHSHGGHGHSHGGGHGHSHSGHSHSSHNNESKDKTQVSKHQQKNNSKELVNVTDSSINKSDANDIPLLISDCDLEMVDLHDEPVEVLLDTGVNENEDSPLSHNTVINEASQLNMRGVYLHVLGDALGSVIVMISALIIMYQDGTWTLYVDPTMSIIMVVIILKTSIPLLKESSMILMQTVPTHIKIQEIQNRLVEKVPAVLSVHEFHIWQLAGNRIIASAHVRCNTLADYMAIANQLKEFFHNEGIHSTTIQPEFVEQPESTSASSEHLPDNCVLECDKDCAERTCCGNINNTTQPITSRDVSKKETENLDTNIVVDA